MESVFVTDPYDAPAAPGFALILRALSVVHDVEVLDLTAPIFEAVHTYLRRSLLTGTDTP